MHNQMTFLLSAMHEDDSEGYRKVPARLAENPQPEQRTKPYKTNTAISHFRLNQKTGGMERVLLEFTHNRSQKAKKALIANISFPRSKDNLNQREGVL